MAVPLKYARGFSATTDNNGLRILTVHTPWPGAEHAYRYALVPREQLASITLPSDLYDAIIAVPVERIALTSTTHIPALELLDSEDKLVGFPGLDYISSPAVRARITDGQVAELGANEQLNTEAVLLARPELVVGFGIADAPRTYRAVEASGIPVVYNGDWTEQSPLGKAEWLKFFGLLFDRLPEAEARFSEIESAYQEARLQAAEAGNRPTVLSGALYRDIWYLPAGDSWAATILEDANADYLWRGTEGTGSLSLSLEAVLEKGAQADFWVAPSQYASYAEMAAANPLYVRFDAFRRKRVIGYAASRGATGGLLYFELGPSRPDLVLKDLVYHLHPGLLPAYSPVFFHPLEP